MYRVLTLSVLALLLVGWTQSLPLGGEDEDSIVVEVDYNVPDGYEGAEPEINEYFRETRSLPLEGEDEDSIVVEVDNNVPEGYEGAEPEINEYFRETRSLPLEGEDGDNSIVVEVDNNVPEGYEGSEPEFSEYFRGISELMDKAVGEPSAETGALVSEYDTTSGVNPEELGNYFQGDILLPTTLGRNGLVTESARWYDGEVPYEIDPNFSPKDLNLIEAAFEEYHKRTCIRFIRRLGHKDYIRLTKENTGCWSSVGRIGGKQDVNLQSPGCTTKVGTIIHELMHALGFMHEQNRSERDTYVTIMWGNIEAGRNNNFDLARQGTVSGFGVTYDYGSVMHYSANAFSTNGSPTIVSKVQGVTMGQREGFSTGDVEKIRAMYRCNGPQQRPLPVC